ncbi:MAG TPA: hypothetical protein VK636_19875 [Gemmatimonadaceae bacterium]|nr:hypothetical protein [Gemmatimonadaceae bacterium]
MTPSRLLLMVMRIAAAIQVVLGIGFWTGRWVGLVGVHRMVGVVFVIALWAIAVLAIAQQRSRAALAAFALLWGLVVAALGFVQQGILPGDLHWIVRCAHLIIALASLPIAERLAKRDETGA